MEKKNNPIPEIEINSSQTHVYARILYYALAVDDDMTYPLYVYVYRYSTD